MLIPESRVRVWLYRHATDMRKSFKGLSALVRNHLDENPISGELFVFINKRRTHIKVLYFDDGGYCIWMKRLEQGRFQLPKVSGHNDKQILDWTTLKFIIDGIDLNSIRQRKRFQLKKAAQIA